MGYINSYLINLSLFFNENSAALGRVCIKLVVIMGVTWVADVLSWAHNVAVKDSNNYSTNHNVRYYFWYIMDAINALQGVLIFIVVASQPQVNVSCFL